MRSIDLYKDNNDNTIIDDLIQLINMLKESQNLYFSICRETKIIKSLFDVFLILLIDFIIKECKI